MNLERVAAVMRPRSYPESVDLGFRMLRAWWRPVLGAWAIVGIPLLVLLAATLHRWPGAVVLLFWWVRPLFARVPVFVLSRSLFGAVPTLKETLLAWPRQLRPGLRDAMTWLRFDPIRSFRTPVVQLEGLEAPAGRRRVRVLARGVRFEATMLTLTCSLFEICIFTGLFLLLTGFHPGLDAPDIIFGGETITLPLQWILVVFYLLSSALIEPFYTAGGFGLYINRRTHLEAWDIEVLFRRMASRLRSARTARIATATLVMALLIFASAGGSPVLGAVAIDEPPDPDEIIEEVLADPIFGVETTETSWEFAAGETQPEPDDAAFAQLGVFLGAMLRAMAWVLAAVGLAWGIFHLLRRSRRRRAPSQVAEPLPPTELLGMDVRETSLPDDVAGHARELWEAGSRQEALRLLYRGALSWLISHDGLPLRPSATENDCVRIAGLVLPLGRLNYLRSLTEAWKATAYGHREPDDVRTPALIQEWNQHFGKPA